MGKLSKAYEQVLFFFFLTYGYFVILPAKCCLNNVLEGKKVYVKGLDFVVKNKFSTLLAPIKGRI